MCALRTRAPAMPLLHSNSHQSMAEHFRVVSTPRLCPSQFSATFIPEFSFEFSHSNRHQHFKFQQHDKMRQTPLAYVTFGLSSIPRALGTAATPFGAPLWLKPDAPPQHKMSMPLRDTSPTSLALGPSSVRKSRISFFNFSDSVCCLTSLPVTPVEVSWRP